MTEQTYSDFIQNILNNRGRFNCGDEYHERHHIKPKCIGGGDEDNNINYPVFKYRCKKHQDFMYYNEWLTLQNDLRTQEDDEI